MSNQSTHLSSSKEIKWTLIRKEKSHLKINGDRDSNAWAWIRKVR